MQICIFISLTLSVLRLNRRICFFFSSVKERERVKFHSKPSQCHSPPLVSFTILSVRAFTFSTSELCISVFLNLAFWLARLFRFKHLDIILFIGQLFAKMIFILKSFLFLFLYFLFIFYFSLVCSFLPFCAHYGHKRPKWFLHTEKNLKFINLRIPFPC